METIMASEQSRDLLLELEAKQRLHELNAAYARAVDRVDQNLLKSLWHDDATVDVGVFSGSADEYCEIITAPNATLQSSFHALTNEYYRIDGVNAFGETYVTGVTTVVEQGEKIERVVGGRYLDRFECRDGEWKFSRRVFVIDWNTNHPSSAVWTEGMMALFTLRGERGPGDPVYKLFQSQD